MIGELSLPLVFVAGVVSFASPCFLPVVPVFVAYLTGSESTRAYPQFAALTREGFIVAAGGVGPRNIRAPKREVPGRSSPRVRSMANAVAFVGAFSAVFILIWLLIATVGWAVGDYRDLMRIGGGVVLILLGLVTAGLLNFQWMSGSNRVPLNSTREPTLRRSALMGLGFGAGWSPCVGPVLGVVLGMAVTSGSAGLGTALLVVYCLGLGLPFLLVAAGATWVTARLQWFSRNYAVIQKVSAALLILLGFLMVANLLAPLSDLSWMTV